MLEAMKEKALRATVAAFLAEAVLVQGRVAEAGELARLSDETGSTDDTFLRVKLLAVEARIAARRGRFAEAEKAGRAAVDRAASTDAATEHAEALMALGDVLALANRRQEALTVVRQAAALFKEKRNRAGAFKAERTLEALTAVPAA